MVSRKSSINRLAPEVKAHIEKQLRDGRLTLDEMIGELQQRFPQSAPPSRSALGRYRKGFDEILKSHRQIAAASEALVAELGENFDDKSGALLAQAVTTLATNAALKANEQDDIEIKDVLDMARAAKSVQEARSLSLKERHAVAKEARERLLEEQKAALAELGDKAGVTDATMKEIRVVLGID